MSVAAVMWSCGVVFVGDETHVPLFWQGAVTMRPVHRRIGFIGCGMMARAMIPGLLAAGITPSSHVLASDIFDEPLAHVTKHHQIRLVMHSAIHHSLTINRTSKCNVEV
jgi:hypothetical protein